MVEIGLILPENTSTREIGSVSASVGSPSAEKTENNAEVDLSDGPRGAAERVKVLPPEGLKLQSLNHSFFRTDIQKFCSNLSDNSNN